MIHFRKMNRKDPFFKRRFDIPPLTVTNKRHTFRRHSQMLQDSRKQAVIFVAAVEIVGGGEEIDEFGDAKVTKRSLLYVLFFSLL